MAGSQLSEAEMEFYREGWRRRREADSRAVEERSTRAITAAREAAGLLRKAFGASRVLLFGSLAEGRFRMRSGIDIAVWGVPHDQQTQANRAVESLCPDIELNLVFGETVRPRFLAEIERSGIDL